MWYQMCHVLPLRSAGQSARADYAELEEVVRSKHVPVVELTVKIDMNCRSGGRSEGCSPGGVLS